MSYKTFNVGDVLTALDVQAIQDQTVIHVNNPADLDALALNIPTGALAYVESQDLLWRLTGSSWLIMPGQMRAILDASAPTDVPTSTVTTVAFPAPASLPHGLSWNAAENAIVVGVAGRYRVMAAGRWQTNGYGHRRLRVQLNGTPLTGGDARPSISGVEIEQSAWAVTAAAPGDKFTVAADHTVAATIEFRGAQLTTETF